MSHQYSQGRRCCLHNSSNTPCQVAPQADMFVAGVPCKPYSTQRAKRFDSGSVKGHRNHDTLFVEFLAWLDFHDPRSGILENVLGIDKPEDSGTKTRSASPLEMPLACLFVRIVFLLFIPFVISTSHFPSLITGRQFKVAGSCGELRMDEGQWLLCSAIQNGPGLLDSTAPSEACLSGSVEGCVRKPFFATFPVFSMSSLDRMGSNRLKVIPFSPTTVTSD